MTTPTGTISWSQIQSEFGGSNPISISEYRGTVAFENTLPTGTISANDLRGKSRAAQIKLRTYGAKGGDSANTGVGTTTGGQGGRLEVTYLVKGGTSTTIRGWCGSAGANESSNGRIAGGGGAGSGWQIGNDTIVAAGGGGGASGYNDGGVGGGDGGGNGSGQQGSNGSVNGTGTGGGGATQSAAGSGGFGSRGSGSSGSGRDGGNGAGTSTRAGGSGYGDGGDGGFAPGDVGAGGGGGGYFGGGGGGRSGHAACGGGGSGFRRTGTFNSNTWKYYSTQIDSQGGNNGNGQCIAYKDGSQIVSVSAGTKDQSHTFTA